MKTLMGFYWFRHTVAEEAEDVIDHVFWVEYSCFHTAGL